MEPRSGASKNMPSPSFPIALLTGAARGIGHAIAMKLAQNGHEIWLILRDQDAANHGIAALQELCGPERPVRIFEMNLAQTASLQHPDFAQVSVLIHNASAYLPYGLIEHGEQQAELELLQVCLSSAMQLTRQVMPGMKRRSFGRLIFTGSSAATKGAHGQVAYATAKAGLIGLARSLALEGGRHGITSNVIEPGLIRTERIQDSVPSSVQDTITNISAMGRIGRPQEVAACAAFLASESASFITGACIPVDGGLGLGVVPKPPTGPGQV